MIPSSFTATATSLLARLRGVELVYTPHHRWPQSSTNSTLRVSVLDSSFNPPTLAHLALASAPPTHSPYDARLLLLSVRNADKTLKQGDATYLQRLEMMYLLAKDMSETHDVAIAITDEPTFVGKSTNLLAFLRSRLSSMSSPPIPTPRLTFLLGLDTLERLFSPRYYPSEEEMLTSLRHFFGEEEGCNVVCARRDPISYPHPSKDLDTPIPPTATEFLNQISLIDIGAEEQALSSSQVRDGRSAGEGWKKSVSPSIARYIEETGLYVA